MRRLLKLIFPILAGLAFVFYGLPYIGDGMAGQITEWAKNLGVSEFVFKLLLAVLCALIVVLIIHFLKGIGIIATIVALAILIFVPTETPGFHPVEKFNSAVENFQEFWAETKEKTNNPGDTPGNM